MNKYIFTFGLKHMFEGFYQPIIARNHKEARDKMISLYGLEWSHQYSESEWKKNEEDGYAMERPLKEVVCQ